MIGEKKEITATDIIRSMKRLGFPYEDIYDTFTGAGISEEEIQILIDRIDADFEDAQIESRTSRLSKEMKEVLDLELEKIKIEIESKFRSLESSMKECQTQLEMLEKRLRKPERDSCRKEENKKT